MKFRNVVAVAAAICFFAIVSLAQTGAIQGKVIGLNGLPLQNAVIKLVRTDIKGNYQTKTNKRGEWIYMGLAVGSTYNVSCEVDGKLMDQTMNVRAGLGDPTETSFNLQKKQGDTQVRQAAMQKAAETGQIGDDLTRGMTPEQVEAAKKQIAAQMAQMKANKALQDAFSAGMTAREAKQYPEAIASFEKAAQMAPTQAAIWANLAETQVDLAATKTGAEFDAGMAKALETYAKAVSLKPDDPNIHSNYARALAMAKKFSANGSGRGPW